MASLCCYNGLDRLVVDISILMTYLFIAVGLVAVAIIIPLAGYVLFGKNPLEKLI